MNNRTALKIKILLVDDHSVVREGAKKILETQPEFEVVAQAGDSQTAMERARDAKPDVILMDISMPGIGGIEATRKIHGELPHIKVIGLSMYEDKFVTDAMLEAGAVAFVRKDCDPAELCDAVRSAAGK
jgi:DNA-binding NarL/FixJ family response regulator